MKALCSPVVGLAVAVALSCGRDTDAKETVRKALDQANIDTVMVEASDNERAVRLKGAVGTLAERTRAEEIANAAVGTSGEVVNELTVIGLDGPIGQRDQELMDSIDRALDTDGVMKQRDVNVQVTDGVVSMTGEVRSAGEKTRAEAIVKRTPGIAGVVNALVVNTEP